MRIDVLFEGRHVGRIAEATVEMWQHHGRWQPEDTPGARRLAAAVAAAVAAADDSDTGEYPQVDLAFERGSALRGDVTSLADGEIDVLCGPGQQASTGRLR